MKIRKLVRAVFWPDDVEGPVAMLVWWYALAACVGFPVLLAVVLAGVMP